MVVGNLPLYQSEFPGFPALEIELPPEFGDDSNGYHDLSPCFLAPTLGLVLWITHPEPTERPEELSPDAKRFCLCEAARPGTYEHACRAVLVETDDWEEVMAVVDGRRRFDPGHKDAVLLSDVLLVVRPPLD